jgi:predicted metal-dependent peptidase
MEENVVLAKRATKKYDEAVRYLLQSNPTLGIILLERLRPVVTYDVDCYYTNGIVIGYNPNAVMRMSILNNVFIIAHEIMHNLMCHSTRRNNRDHRLWNVAGDYCINSILTSMRIGEMPTDPDGNPNGLIDDKYDGTKLSTEAVYDMLNEKMKPKKHDSLKEKLSKLKSNTPSEGTPQGDGHNADNPIESDKPDTIEDLISKHFKEEIIKSQMGLVEDFVAEIPDKWTASTDTNIPVSGQELEDMFIEARIHGEFAGEKSSGEGGFDLHGIVELNSLETVSWEQELQEYLTIKCKSKKNWMKPSNKWLQHGFWMPTRGGKSIDDIVIMIDESGSMSEREIQAVFTNMSDLFESGDIPLCKVAVIHFAGYSWVHDEHVEVVEEGDMPEYKRRVSGGTNFQGAFNKAKEMEVLGNINPSCYIVMTDMEDQFPPEPDFPVLWMSTQSMEQISCWPGIPEYGKFTHLVV